MKKSIVNILLSFSMMAATLGCDSSDRGPVSIGSSAEMQENSAARFSMMREVLDVITTDSLATIEADALLFMREEEKLARDIYIAMETKWNLRPFTNIKSSEETHMSALLYLIERYGLKDPVGLNAPGQFVDAALQNLYNDLLQKGNTSVNDALTVGAIIEEVDIVDLKVRSLASDNKDINYVYEQLMLGSRNHLRAFVKNLKSRGVIYSPQYLSQEEYDAIIAGANENGNGARSNRR
jgi:hypothetical protein